MDFVVLRGNAELLRAAPGDRPHIGVALAVFLQHEALGRVDLGDRIGDFEIEHLRRPLQPFRVFGALEDIAAIGALAFEHGARIVQAMGADVKRGVAPRHQLAIVPDDPIEPVIRFIRHGASSVNLALVRAEFPSVLNAFASRANTRYVSAPHQSAPAARAQWSGEAWPCRHDPFVAA